MSVQDHGLEALRKSIDKVTSGDNSEYVLKVKASSDDAPVIVSTGQLLSTGNSITISDALYGPADPWIGDWVITRSLGYVRILTIVRSNVLTGLGGTLTYEFSEDGITAAISETRVITSFSVMRDFDLIVLGEYFRVKFEPSRTMTGGEFIYISTALERAFDGKFTRLPGQEVEEQNAAMGSFFTYPKLFTLQGTSTTQRAGGRDPLNSSYTGLGIGESFAGTYRDSSTYAAMSVLVSSDVELGLVTITWSEDGVSPRTGDQAIDSISPVLSGGVYTYFKVITTMVDRYFKVDVTNGGTETSTFELNTWLNSYTFAGYYGKLNSTLTNLDTGLLVRSINAGVDPNDSFVNIRVQGSHDANSTTSPLDSTAVYRGTWFNWEVSYIKLISNLRSDVAGTLYIDLSEEVSPTDGDDTGITLSIEVPYDPTSVVLLRRMTVVQSKWVRHRYVNGISSQSVFVLNAAFAVSDPGLSAQALSLLPNIDSVAGIVRSVLAIQTADGLSYQEVPVDSVTGNIKTTVSDIRADVLIKPLDTAKANQVIVGTTAAQIDISPLTNRRIVIVTNEGTGSCSIGHSDSITYDSNSIRCSVGSTKTFELSESVPIYAVSENLGGVTNVLTLSPSSASGTVTNPSNVTADDSSYANMTIAQAVTATTFTAGTTNPLISVKIGVNGNKETGQFETAAYLETVVGEAGNVGSVTSPSITGDETSFYLAAISRENSLATTTSVTGLGLTWLLVESQENPTKRLLDVYRASGNSSVFTGTVTATFSTNALNTHIAVSRYSNVDLVSPIESSSSAFSQGGTTTVGPISGTNKGICYFAAAIDNTTFTPGAGYVERSDDKTADGGNKDGLATQTKALTLTGSETPTGTLSGATGWAAIALTLTPAEAINPSLTLSYTLSASPGATSGVVTFTFGTDASTTVDITEDRVWVFGDIANVNVVATALTISAAKINIDFLYIEITDSTSNSSRLSVWQGSRAIT